ncbi:MAG: NAD-dependent epimerase/dehydratase family protein [Actinobacteria bacterium]|nr:NAD-dependent epimerase/dehydratase family protein [Actinomycetota bacterium]
MSTSLAGRKVLVTGGSGFIGRYVTRELAAAGADVTVVHTPHSDDRIDVPAAVVEAVLGEDDIVYHAVEGVDAVVHLAARSGGIQMQQADHAGLFVDNVRITRQVFDAALRADVGAVYAASSAVVYASAQPRPMTEDAPKIEPGHPGATGYAWSKLTDEAIAQWYSARIGRVVIGRFANVYGPGATFDPERSTVVHSLVKKAVDAAPGGTLRVWGAGDVIRSFIHVRDAARAVVTILERAENGSVYNIDSADPVSIRRLAETIRAIVDPSLDVRFDPSKPAGPPFRVLDTTALRALGFEPGTALTDGLGETVEAYRSLA